MQQFQDSYVRFLSSGYDVAAYGQAVEAATERLAEVLQADDWSDEAINMLLEEAVKRATANASSDDSDYSSNQQATPASQVRSLTLLRV
jgi:hypothetical protein